MRTLESSILDRRRMAAGDRPNLQADHKRSNPAAEAFQRRKSASAGKGLRRLREEIWDAAAERAAAEPLVRFLVLHKPMDVQLHCVINKGFSWRGKLSFSHTASLDAV